MKKSKRRTLIALAVAAMLAGIIGFAPLLTVEVASQAEHRFMVDARMQRVRKILVRTNAVKKIVAMADATLLDQAWQNMAFESEGSLLSRDWQVHGDGQLTVQMNDRYLGEQTLRLNQSVDIQPARLHSTNDLVEPSKSVRRYRSTLTLTPDASNNAQFDTTLSLTVRTTAGLLTRAIVEREIRAAAMKSLNNQERAIQDIVQEHADKLIIMPDFGQQATDDPSAP